MVRKAARQHRDGLELRPRSRRQATYGAHANDWPRTAINAEPRHDCVKRLRGNSGTSGGAGEISLLAPARLGRNVVLSPLARGTAMEPIRASAIRGLVAPGLAMTVVAALVCHGNE